MAGEFSWLKTCVMAGVFVMDVVFYSQLCWLPSCIFGHPFNDRNT